MIDEKSKSRRSGKLVRNHANRARDGLLIKGAAIERAARVAFEQTRTGRLR